MDHNMNDQQSHDDAMNVISDELSRTPIDDSVMTSANVREFQSPNQLTTPVSINSFSNRGNNTTAMVIDRNSFTGSAESPTLPMITSTSVTIQVSPLAVRNARNAQINPSNERQESAEFVSAETQNQSQLRQMILAIHKDPTLSPSQKSRKIQELMTTGARLSSLALQASEKSNEQKHLNANKSGQAFRLQDGHALQVTEQELQQEKNQDGELGCKHYLRNVKLQAKCCGVFSVCRFCHDEKHDHAMDRHATDTMMCMFCRIVQPAAQECANSQCAQIMAAYYCNVCKLWDNTPGKQIFHCDKCGICRLGKGLGEDYFHCDKCNVCLDISLQDNHRCIERNLESNCPICDEFMFTSTETVVFMPCGHSIHHDCYQEHIKNSYQCPICWKSLADMKHYFGQIDRMLEEHIMPAEYQDYISEVLCNDCEQKSKTKYHFLYHKCQNCGSYNTKILQMLQERTVVGLANVDVQIQAQLTSTATATENMLSPVVENQPMRSRTVSAASSNREESEGHGRPT